MSVLLLLSSSSVFQPFTMDIASVLSQLWGMISMLSFLANGLEKVLLMDGLLVVSLLVGLLGQD